MNSNKASILLIIAIIILAAICLAFTFSSADFTYDFFEKIIILSLTTYLISKVNFRFLPVSSMELMIDFSNTVILISYLLFGGSVALAVSTISVSLIVLTEILKKQNMPLPATLFNIGSEIINVSITVSLCDYFVAKISPDKSLDNIHSILPVVFIYSVSSFLLNSSSLFLYFSFRNGTKFLNSVKESFSALYMVNLITTIAGLMALFLINNLNIVTLAIGATATALFYLTYRKIVGQVNRKGEEARLAQEEKSKAEKLRAEQAEHHAAELAASLAVQERIGEELQKTNFALENIAYQDQLTKLPNRAYFLERIRLLLKLNIELQDNYYLLFLNLSRFKNINDSLGHNIGDKVLSLVGRRLRRMIKDEDTVARIGGDEFAIVLSDMPTPESVMETAEQIYKVISQPFSLNGQKIFTSANIGISTFESDHTKPEDMLRDADIAMQHAKETSKGFAFFDKDLRSALLTRLKLESDLHFAIQRNELQMYYQPVISLKDGELLGFESLLRWNHHSMGFILPAVFIPIAEESELIINITDWILEVTTLQLAEWQKISRRYRDLMVSVNISARHLSQERLVKEVNKSIANSLISASSLKLEITETTAMSDAERTIEILERLKETGTQLSIDDFGTGYSSLSHLHKLPFDTLKIDRSFVSAVNEKGENGEILQTIVSLAKNLKMRVIAEGIETESQFELLRNLGCDYGQGYLFAKPMPKEEIEALLYQRHSWLPQSKNQNTSDSTSQKKLPSVSVQTVH